MTAFDAIRCSTVALPANNLAALGRPLSSRITLVIACKQIMSIVEIVTKKVFCSEHSATLAIFLQEILFVFVQRIEYQFATLSLA